MITNGHAPGVIDPLDGHAPGPAFSVHTTTRGTFTWVRPHSGSLLESGLIKLDSARLSSICACSHSNFVSYLEHANVS